MKYISILLFVALMAWTWSLATSNRGLSLEAHKDTEALVEETIRSYIQQKSPGVTDIVFRQLYTEVVRENQEMNVKFRYELKEPLKSGDVTSQTYQGVIRLVSNDGGHTWAWTDQDVSSPAIRFEKGSQISTKEPESASEQTEPETETVAPSADPNQAPAHEEHQQ